MISRIDIIFQFVEKYSMIYLVTYCLYCDKKNSLEFVCIRVYKGPRIK